MIPPWLDRAVFHRYIEPLEESPRRWLGKRVTTNPQGGRDFNRAMQSRRRADTGVINGWSDAHGLCFRVKHADGVEAYYDSDEIVEFTEAPKPKEPAKEKLSVWDRVKGDPLV